MRTCTKCGCDITGGGYVIVDEYACEAHKDDVAQSYGYDSYDQAHYQTGYSLVKDDPDDPDFTSDEVYYTEWDELEETH